MIGALISMKLVGKKTWIQALVFWAVVLIVGYAISMGAGPVLGIFATVLNIFIFIALAHYWYHLAWIWSIVVWAVAFVIDMVIMFVIIMIFAGFAFSMFPGVF